MPDPTAPLTARRTYLELRSPEAHRREPWTATDVHVERRTPCSVAESRALYRLVGEPYQWHDRNAWSDERLAAHLARPDVGVWTVRDDGGRPGGYFELARHDDGAVEIVYFGLVDRLHGRRLGAQLLTAAVDEAWAMGAARVVLNTCTLDGPAALPNYLARGFRVVREETYVVSPPR